MKIIFGNIMLEQVDSSPIQFNVHKLAVLPNGMPKMDKDGNRIFTTISWGVIMRFAIDEVVHLTLLENDTLVTPISFLKAYNDIYLRFNKQLQEQIKELKILQETTG